MRDNEFIRFLLDKKCLFGNNTQPASVCTHQLKSIGKPFSDDVSGLQLNLVMLHKVLGQLDVVTLGPSITLCS